MTGPGTNTYLVGIDEVVVVDPGPDDDGHLDAIVGCGGDRIRWIVCTHTHPDHHPGTARLKALTGAEVLAFDVPRRPRDRRLARRRRPHRGHRVPPPRGAHPRARVQPPLLPAGGGAPALLRRPRHAGLDRRDRPARRRHGRVPGVARTAPRPAARAAGDRSRATATSSPTPPARSTSTWPTGGAGARRSCDVVRGRRARSRRPRSSSSSTPTSSRSWCRGPGSPSTPTCASWATRRRRQGADPDDEASTWTVVQ